MRRTLILLFLSIAVLSGCAGNRPKEADAVPAVSNPELARLSLEIARLEAQQSRLKAQMGQELNEYQSKQPRRVFVSGQRAGEFQSYVTSCLKKVAATGNQNYPEEARGKIYGNLIATFTLDHTGNLENVAIDRTSGHKVLDDAIVDAIKRSAPFPEFPAVIRAKLDQLSITQLFSFEREEPEALGDDDTKP